MSPDPCPFDQDDYPTPARHSRFAIAVVAALLAVLLLLLILGLVAT